jgi:hypothetical protein
MREPRVQLLNNLHPLARAISYKSDANEILTLNSEYFDDCTDTMYRLSVEVEVQKRIREGRVEIRTYDINRIELYKNIGEDCDFIIDREALYKVIEF